MVNGSLTLFKLFDGFKIFLLWWLVYPITAAFNSLYARKINNYQTLKTKTAPMGAVF